MPRWFWKKVMVLGVSIVLLGLLLATFLSNFELMRRIETMEYKQQLFFSDSMHAEKSCMGREIYRRSIERKQQIKSIFSSVDKMENDLHQINRQPANYIQQLGRTDYALESAGAEILSTGRTQLLSPIPTLEWLQMLGFGRISNYFVNGANRVIQPSIQAGECFAFTGPGEIIIKLIKTVFIDAVSVEHILPQMSPDGNISTAPNDFRVYGMESANGEAVLLGSFCYDIETNQSRQEFQLARHCSAKSFPIVKFEFAPSHSYLNYTCVYRVQVHGSLEKPN